MTHRRLLLLCGALWALASGAEPALASEEGGLHSGSWLNWLYSVRVAGHPLVSDQASLSFAWSLVAALLVAAIAAWGTRRISLRPRGMQTLLEMMVGGLRSFVVGVMGPEGERFVPFIGTLFIYIAFMNLLGLVPGFVSPTASLSTTAALALVVFVVVQFYGFRNHGLGYVKHFVEGVPLRFPFLLLAPLVFVIHLVGEVFRPVTLALRLFGNITGEEIVILSLTGLAAGLLRHYIVVPLQLPNMMLALVTSVVQALIFSTLATVYLAGVCGAHEAAES